MNRSSSDSPRRLARRAVPAIASLAIVALIQMPPAGAVDAPPVVELRDGGTGFINAEQSTEVMVRVHYDTDHLPPIVYANGRVVGTNPGDPTCASNPPHTTPNQDTVVPQNGFFELGPFDVSSFPEGTVLCARAFVRDSTNVNSQAGTSNTAILDTIAPAVGTAEFFGEYADDGFINAEEAALPDPGGRPVNWTAGDASATGAQGRFTDDTDAIIMGGSCGPFNLSVNGTGSNGWLNLSCMGASPEGEIRWQVRWRDAAGNWSDWASDSIIVDRIPPDVVIEQPLDGDQVQVGSTVTIAGTTEPDAPLTYILNGSEVGTDVASDTGAFSTQVSDLAVGVHTFVVEALDAAGNLGSASVSFEVDPLIPVIILPGEGSIEGATVTIYGHGERLSTVEVFESGTLIGSTQVSSQGEWVIVTGLSDGAKTIVARATAQDGTVSVDSQPRSFIVDAGRPTVTITTSDFDLVVGNTLVEGTATDNEEGVEAIVVSYYNLLGARAFQHEAACTLCGAGATEVEWQSDPSLLLPGIYRVTAQARDMAGNLSLEQSITLIVLVP